MPIPRSHVLLSLLTMILCTITVSGCYGLRSLNDPESETPGYKLFTSKKIGGLVSGVRIRFEYPDTWSASLGEAMVYLWSQDSYVIVESDYNSRKGMDYANAAELTEDWLDWVSTEPEFQLLSRAKAQLGQAQGEEVMFSYLFHGSDPHVPLVPIDSGTTAITRSVIADYKGRIYYIDLLVAADRYDQAKVDFERILETFEFLD